jgi:hypothetical protein
VDSSARSLFFRVLSTRPAAVSVELWELGALHGTRHVSTEGSAQLRARRIALAAAELARQLRQRRLIEARRRKTPPPREAERPPGTPVFARMTLSAAFTGAAMGPDDVWLVGPQLSGGLRFDNGARLELSARWMAGGAPALAGSSTVRWLELGLSPSYTSALSKRLSLDAGLTAAVAAVHLTDISELSGEGGALDTWSARAAAFSRLELRLVDGWGWLCAGPDAGVVLRRLRVTDSAGEEHRLGGLWLGLTVAWLIDPAAR